MAEPSFSISEIIFLWAVYILMDGREMLSVCKFLHSFIHSAANKPGPAQSIKSSASNGKSNLQGYPQKLTRIQWLSIGLIRSPVWAIDNCDLDTVSNRDGKRKQLSD